MVDIRHLPADDEEAEIVDGILRIGNGKRAELIMSALVRVMFPLIVGSHKDKEGARVSIEKVRGYLMGEVLSVPEDQFGFILEEGNDDPIYYKDKH